jgi:hypothetical protein
VCSGRCWHSACLYFVSELLFITSCCYLAACEGCHLSGQYFYNRHSNKCWQPAVFRNINNPHLQVECPSLNPLSFHLTIGPTQLYIICSVQSAVLINTSFCCFPTVRYCLLNCFLCGLLQDLPNSGSSATAATIVVCTSEWSCTGMHVHRDTDRFTS